MVKVMIELQKQDSSATTVESAQRKVAVNILLHATDDKATENDSNGGDDNIKKYSMCSLLLQIGKVLGVRPPHTPGRNIYTSSLFNKLLDKWCLRCDESNSGSRSVYQISDINDGDNIVLSCGDYVNDSTASVSSSEVDLMALIPAKYKFVTISKENVSLAKMRATNNNLVGAGAEYHRSVDVNDEDDDSDIEDVTDCYRSNKPRVSQEVIDVEDVSSVDDENDNCFWEYDEFGNMKRIVCSSRKERKNYAQSSKKGSKSDDDASSNMERNQDVESISSDSDSSSGVEDVTDIMMDKRKEQAQKMIDDAEEICDSDIDCPEVQGDIGNKRKMASAHSQSNGKKRKKKKEESKIEVLIEDEDIPIRPGAKGAQTANGDTANRPSPDSEVDHSIKQRIVKLLNTGFHGESNEHEARNAMKLARRLIERHNLDQAVLLQERGDGSLNDFSTSNEEEGSLVGGFVIAKIRNRKKKKPLSSLPRWHDYLVQPVCMNFHVEAFKTVERGTALRAGECSVTFYGIRTNAQLAAYAFKIASEMIALMAATYEPRRRSNLPRGRRMAETRRARLSYAVGIVKGLERDVKEGLRKEEETRKSNLRKAQSAAKAGEAYHEDSSNSDSGDHDSSSCHFADGHGDSAKIRKDEVDHPEKIHGKTSSDVVDRLDELERENTAHLALVDHHKKIASNVLKSKDIKVRKAKKHKFIALNRKAYEKGVIDSKEVDLNQQAIKQ